MQPQQIEYRVPSKREKLMPGAIEATHKALEKALGPSCDSCGHLHPKIKQVATDPYRWVTGFGKCRCGCLLHTVRDPSIVEVTMPDGTRQKLQIVGNNNLIEQGSEITFSDGSKAKVNV